MNNDNDYNNGYTSALDEVFNHLNKIEANGRSYIDATELSMIKLELANLLKLNSKKRVEYGIARAVEPEPRAARPVTPAADCSACAVWLGRGDVREAAMSLEVD